MKRSVPLVVLGLATSAAAFAFPAGGDCSTIDPVPASFERYCPAVDPAAPAGLRIFVDPITGRIRQPTPEELRALAQEPAAEAAGARLLEIVRYPDGMRSVDLQDAFTFQVVARRNPDGSISVQCVPPNPSPER